MMDPDEAMARLARAFTALYLPTLFATMRQIWRDRRGERWRQARCPKCAAWSLVQQRPRFGWFCTRCDSLLTEGALS